jgi:dTMP kinase
VVKFITFEGIEGSGKSTQTKLLFNHFNKINQPAILTREPGGTKVAEEIRNLLVNGDIGKFDGITETLLNFAARRDHVEKLIKPTLKAGKTVICDRFFDSTYAYQGFGYELDLALIENVKKLAINDFAPDITFLIDIDVEMAMERIISREDNNRYEKMDISFHQKVRKGFLEIAKNNPRIKIINGAKSVPEIHYEIIGYLSK